MPCSLLGCVCGKAYLPMRFLMTFMCILGVITTYGQRVCLNMAITQMVSPSSSQSTDCPFLNTTTKEKVKIEGGELPWTNTEQNAILGAFYIGYLLGHVPAGIWSDQLGARHVYSGGVMISTIVTIVTPIVCLKTPWWVAGFSRIIMGVGQAVVYPAISTLNARWVPKSERSVTGAFSFAANSLGVICGNLFSGQIVHWMRNWHACFYFWGVLGIIWYVSFLLFVYSRPETHPHVTEMEKTMLDEKLAHVAVKFKIPWAGFFKDWAIWGLIIAEIGHDFTIFTLITNMPKYMSDVLHYDIKQNSMVSSFPFLGQWLSGVISGRISDYVISRKKASIVFMRRLYTTIGLTLPAFFVLIAGYMDCKRILVITFFSINLLVKGPFYCGMKVNHLDMSVNFPGIIMAFVNGAGAMSGYFSPMIIAYLAKNSVVYPTISTLNAKWVPPNERSISGAITFSSSSLGTICGNLLSGFIVYGTNNWHSAFYFWGIFGVAWYVLFLLFVFSQPSTHPFITEKEKLMLSEKITVASVDIKIPWGPLFKDIAIWSLLIGEIGHDFTILTLITSMPKYMSDVLHYDIKNNAMVSSLPFLGQWICGVISGRIGLTVPAAFVVVAGYMNCNKTWVVTFFAICLFTKGPFYCGMKVNHLDMSINFAGIVMAFTNGIGAIAGYFSPMIISYVAKDNTLVQWHNVFWINFAVAALTNLFYLFTATDQRRIWDVKPEEIDEFRRKQEEYKAEKAERKLAKKRAKEAKRERK